MTEERLTLHEYLSNLDLDGGFLREGIRVLSQLLMELEVEEQIGAGRYERSAERVTHRNGMRPRRWETRVGEISLEVPKLREGTYFPSFLEPRRPSEKALLAVVQSAYIQGVSTRRVDVLLKAMGLTGIDKSKVSRINAELDEVVDAFRNRPLTAKYPYLWLDAIYLKVRCNHRYVNRALVIAIGVSETGDREVLGLSLGPSEEAAFWLEFLRSLAARGLTGVRLVISDNHKGITTAQSKVFEGATWQRCRVHLMRNVLAHIPKGSKQLVASALRTIFAQGDRVTAGQQLSSVVDGLREHWPEAAHVLEEAEDDVLAYMSFPKNHWVRIHSTNPLERVNKEIRRRTNVVGGFPDDASVIRLVGTILREIDDEWQVGRRYFSLESMAMLDKPDHELVDAPTPFTLSPIKSPSRCDPLPSNDCAGNPSARQG